MRNRHLLGCLLLSGFAGLAYELLWIRLLALGFGSTTLSYSTVLAVFFGGLALGAWLGGRRASRMRRPVRVYALLEIGTGLLGLGLYPFIAHVGEVFALIDPGAGLSGAVVRALLAVPLLLGPTVLMGATLPAVVRAVVVEDREVGSGSALIYGFNTLGAFFGAYLVTYFLIPELGVFASTLTVAVVNFAAAGLALAFEDRQPAPEVQAPERPTSAEEVPDKIRLIASVLALVTGFAAICLQVVWVRLFSIFLEGTVYGVGAVLMAVLAGIGLGSLLIARPLRNSTEPGLWLAALQVILLGSVGLLALLLPWVAYLLRSVAETGASLGTLHLQLLLTVLALLVPSLASGASFPLLMAVVERRAASAGGALGRLYAANTVGSILGSVLTGFVLIPVAGSGATLYLGAVAVAFVGAAAAGLLATARPVTRAVFAAAPLALAAGWPTVDIPRISVFSPAMTTGASYARFSKVLDRALKQVSYLSEGRSATVVVTDSKDSRSLRLNGLGQGSRRVQPPHLAHESLMVALVPLSHVPAVDRALVVGLGAGATVDALRRLGAGRTTVIELEPDVVEGLSHIFPDDLSPLADPTVEVRIGDARHALLVGARQGKDRYDLITSMPAHPWVASSIFTQEFFELAKENLTETGVFSTWFGLQRMDQVALDGLVRAFVLTFENYIVYRVPEAGALYLVGSKAPLTVNVGRLEALLENPVLAESRVVTSAYHLAQRVAATGRAGDPPPSPGPINTDDSALVETRAPRTATAASDLSDLLPYPHLRADVLEPVEGRGTAAVELLERWLGSPGGKIPVEGHRRAPTRQFAAHLAGLSPALGEEERTYFEGRLAQLRGERERARSLLSSVRSPHLEGRARRFLASTHRAGPRRAAALALAPNEGDVWAAQLGLDRDAVVARLREEPPPLEEDGLGWLLWHGLAPGAPAMAWDARLAPVLDTVRRGQNLAALEVVAELAKTSGQPRLALGLERAAVALRGNTVRTELRLARAAGGRGDFATAAAHLQKALDLGEASAELFSLSLRAAAELEREADIEELIEGMRLAGHPEPLIEHLLAEARAGVRAGRNRP